MDRALDPALLGLALGEPTNLPSAEQLAHLLAEAELGLLLNRPHVEPDLLRTGWYLFGIASSRKAIGIYGVSRVRASFRVAAHVFDIALRSPETSDATRLRLGFASQVAYLRSELDPNSVAIYNLHFKGSLSIQTLLAGSDNVALALGIAFLGLDTRLVLAATAIIRDEIVGFSERWAINSVMDTVYAGPATVALGVRALVVYLLYGSADSLTRARDRFARLLSEPSDGDLLSRWVAYHLSIIADGLSESSVWAALPPEVPRGVRAAFATAAPRVLTLWPPQLALFRSTGEEDAPNPLDPAARRVFLATPTSSGKTLIAQLMIATHLSTTNSSVCYVAPTRALCHEVRSVLDRRLRYMRKAVGMDIQEQLQAGTLGAEADVQVMTPERLELLMRDDAESVLQRFGLFIFDEVHNVSESERGWTLEGMLSYLHYATVATPHRIVLMSAAVGNQNHLLTWLSAGDLTPRTQRQPWRGPRRMHCIWTTTINWNTVADVDGKSKKYPKRRIYPLNGVLHVRLGTGNDRRLATTAPIGQVEFHVRPDGSRAGIASRPTGLDTLLPIIELLGQAGPVLVVEATRPQTVRMALRLAAFLPTSENIPLRHIADLVGLRLGTEHPLVGALRKGVAYHHGSLPQEIRQVIEDAVRDGHLRYLIATTTMTEGVNLPVTSVVVANQGSFTDDGYQEYIKGSKLINAIGRAGRATRETEGIVLLARHAEFTAADFDRLDPEEEDYTVVSWLASEEALRDLAEFEMLQREATDIVLSTAGGSVASFISFIWFVAAQLERLQTPITDAALDSVLARTLAWVQLKSSDRERWTQVARATLTEYVRTAESPRVRWSRTSRSLASAVVLERLAADIVIAVGPSEDLLDPHRFIEVVLTPPVVDRLLLLTEAPNRRVFDRRAGKNRRDITPSLTAVLRDWVNGAELIDLATLHFGGVVDVDYRFEQLGDFLNDYFEVFLPAVLATLIRWANEFLTEASTNPGELLLFPYDAPSYIRWGVGDSASLELMSSGLSSRRLATKAARIYRETGTTDPVRDWLGRMTIQELRDRFDPSVAELRSLVDVARGRNSSLAAQLLAGEEVTISFQEEVHALEEQNAELLFVEADEYAPIRILIRNQTIGHVMTSSYSDLQGLVSSGYSFAVSARVNEDGAVLTLRLMQPADEGER